MNKRKRTITYPLDDILHILCRPKIPGFINCVDFIVLHDRVKSL
jgi:hypothetical protein